MGQSYAWGEVISHNIENGRTEGEDKIMPGPLVGSAMNLRLRMWRNFFADGLAMQKLSMMVEILLLG